MVSSNNKNHRNQSALITGAAKRLGACMAKCLANEGYDLYLHYFESETEMGFLEKEIKSHFSVKVKCIRGDIIKSIHSVTSQCENLSPLKILINNASLFLRENFSEAVNFEKQITLNTIRPLELSEWFHKRVSVGGVIVNMTDANIQRVNKDFQNYRFSKLMLTEITRQTALTYAPKIRVNAIAPGPILLAEGDSQDQFLKQVEKTPLKISPNIEAISSCLKFILHSPFLTGQILYADSGVHLL